MSNERTYEQALAEMTADPGRQYTYGGSVYQVVDGTLQYDSACGRFFDCIPRQRKEFPWFRLEKDGEAFSAPSGQLELNICSDEIPPPAKNPNPKKAYGATKPSLALIPPAALLYEAMAFEDGADKYGPYNWRKDPVEAMTYLNAAMRHLQAWLDGEERTVDSNVHNLGAVRACCGILLDSQELGSLIDNRPAPGKASPLQEKLKAEKQARGK